MKPQVEGGIYLADSSVYYAGYIKPNNYLVPDSFTIL